MRYIPFELFCIGGRKDVDGFFGSEMVEEEDITKEFVAFPGGPSKELGKGEMGFEAFACGICHGGEGGVGMIGDVSTVPVLFRFKVGRGRVGMRTGVACRR